MPNLSLPIQRYLLRPGTTANISCKFHDHRRVDWVDYCKGLGIFYVVLGHVLRGLRQGVILSDSPLCQFTDNWLYSFHMPLFFFLSGLFVQRSTRRSVAEFTLDKAAVLVYPYFVWSILQGLAETSHYANHPIAITDLLKIGWIPIAQYWFFYTLFSVFLIYMLFNTMFASDIPFLCVSISWFVLERSGLELIKWDVMHYIGSFAVYFAAGAAVAPGSILMKFAELRNRWLLAICIGAYGVVALEIVAHPEHDSIVMPARAAAGIIATIGLAILIARSAKFSLIKLWGILSLEIYVAHSLAAAPMRVALYRILDFREPWLYIVVCVFVGLHGPIFLAYVCHWLGFPYAFRASGWRLQSWAESSSRT